MKKKGPTFITLHAASPIQSRRPHLHSKPYTTSTNGGNKTNFVCFLQLLPLQNKFNPTISSQFPSTISPARIASNYAETTPNGSS